jgi:hypothetical protein
MLRMQSSGGRAMTIRPRVTAASPGSTFEWLGHLGVPGIFDGRHRFELTATSTGTHLVQRDSSAAFSSTLSGGRWTPAHGPGSRP